MLEFLDKVSISCDRNRSRTEFDAYFWSANKVNFRPDQMQQHARGHYRGYLTIARVPRASTIRDIEDTLAQQGLELAEVVEGFYFGMRHQPLVEKHRSILIPGTIGAPASDGNEAFCPMLFQFGSSVSYGIEQIDMHADGPGLARGTLCLVRSRG